MFDQNFFIQLLEGPRLAVYRTFKKIEIDRRNTDVELLEFKSVADREFASWSMGGSLRTKQQDAIYQQHGIGLEIRSATLEAEQVASLLRGVSAFERDRRAAGHRDRQF